MMGTALVAQGRCTLVLLVEDNIMDACLVLKYLKCAKTPNRVVVMRDGLEALDYLKREGAYAGNKEAPSPDLILLDLTLPLVTGIDVLRRIKQDEDLKHIPVIVLTESKSKEDILECYEALANFYISKPNDLLEFVEIMKYVEDVWLKP